jgi:hypothetical protein
MDQLLSLLPSHYLVYVAAISGVAGAIAMVLPAPTPTSAPGYVFLYQAVNFIGSNKFHATNATDPSQTKGSTS